MSDQPPDEATQERTTVVEPNLSVRRLLRMTVSDVGVWMAEALDDLGVWRAEDLWGDNVERMGHSLLEFVDEQTDESNKAAAVLMRRSALADEHLQTKALVRVLAFPVYARRLTSKTKS